MTQEDKELLLKDLCTRLPYEVKVQYNNEIYNIDYISALYEEVKLDIPDNYTIGISEIKPYLRPMSSMTETEKEDLLKNVLGEDAKLFCVNGGTIESSSNNEHQSIEHLHLCWPNFDNVNASHYIDWLNKNMFDYRGLIEKGLALEAPEGMYN